MINKQLLSIMLMFVAFTEISQISLSRSRGSEKMTWTQMPMDQIRETYERADLSDEEKIASLTRYLDHRISISHFKNEQMAQPGNPVYEDEAYDYVILIRLMAERPYPNKPQSRAKEVQAVLNRLNQMPEIQNKKKTRSYLYIALAQAGGKAPEAEIVGMMNNPKTPELMLLAVVDAAVHSQVPIRALPRLLKLSRHPRNSLAYQVDVGPAPPPRRIYPIREAACQALHKLGIKCQLTLVPAKNPPQPSALPETVIRIDRASLVAKLQAWLLSNDRKIWQATADIVYKIPGKDVQAMLNDLLRSGKLSAEKKQVLATARKAAGARPR